MTKIKKMMINLQLKEKQLNGNRTLSYTMSIQSKDFTITIKR